MPPLGGMESGQHLLAVTATAPQPAAFVLKGWAALGTVLAALGVLADFRQTCLLKAGEKGFRMHDKFWKRWIRQSCICFLTAGLLRAFVTPALGAQGLGWRLSSRTSFPDTCGHRAWQTQ